LYVSFVPGEYMSKNGVGITTSPSVTPGRFTCCQKYCAAPSLLNVSTYLVGCSRFVFSGFLFSAVMLSPMSIYEPKKKTTRRWS
jgi:hypothetical protein